MNSRQTGILRLKHAREIWEAESERMAADRQRFAALADPASAPRVVSAFNLFQTPEILANQIAQLFADRPLGRILEPSAGLGRLYHAIRRIDPASPIVLIEIAQQCAAELYRITAADASATLLQRDFLTVTPEEIGLFDAIYMNPPFKMGRDIKHIQHARRFLAPGGRLVSFCAAGPRQRAALMPNASVWTDLPEGSFKSEGTAVAASVVVFQG